MKKQLSCGCVYEDGALTVTCLRTAINDGELAYLRECHEMLERLCDLLAMRKFGNDGKHLSQQIQKLIGSGWKLATGPAGHP